MILKCQGNLSVIYQTFLKKLHFNIGEVKMGRLKVVEKILIIPAYGKNITIG